MGVFGGVRQKIFSVGIAGTAVLVFFWAGTGFAKGRDADPGTNDTANATAEIPEWMQPASYRYDPKDKPDPFVSFIRKEEAQALRPLETKPDRPLTPLEKIDATQLKAIGILWYPGKENTSLAMVQLPDGKGFVLKKGMRVGRRNGVVDAITPEAIVVKERGLDMFGKEQTRDVLIKLHSKKKAQND